MSTTTAIKTAEFGIIGLGVMTQNLALNIEDHGEAQISKSSGGKQ